MLSFASARTIVFVSEDVDTCSIQKCLVDFDCQFIRLMNSSSQSQHLNQHVTKTQDKHKYFILYKTYFAVHVGGQLVKKCSYDCRNRVMSFAFLEKSSWMTTATKQAFEDNNYGLDLIDGIIHNNELPHLIFTNERYYNSFSDPNTIMENYTTIDLQIFADITKTKACKQSFFVVHFSNLPESFACQTTPANLSQTSKGPFMCCSMKTLEFYEYNFNTRHDIEQALLKDADICFAKWKAEKDAVLAKRPAARISDFRLRDIEGNPVEENIDYYIGLYEHPETILRIDRSSKLYVNILTPYRLKNATRMVVRYTVKNGIHYLTHESRFLSAIAQDIKLKDEEPAKDQRLEFHATEGNTFKIVKWNKHIWLTFERNTVNNSFVTFDNCEETVIYGTPLELFLKRV